MLAAICDLANTTRAGANPGGFFRSDDSQLLKTLYVLHTPTGQKLLSIALAPYGAELAHPAVLLSMEHKLLRQDCKHDGVYEALMEEVFPLPPNTISVSIAADDYNVGAKPHLFHRSSGCDLESHLLEYDFIENVQHTGLYSQDIGWCIYARPMQPELLRDMEIPTMAHDNIESITTIPYTSGFFWIKTVRKDDFKKSWMPLEGDKVGKESEGNILRRDLVNKILGINSPLNVSPPNTITIQPTAIDNNNEEDEDDVIMDIKDVLKMPANQINKKLI